MRFMFAALLWLITFSSVDVASAETSQELTTQCAKGNAVGCVSLGTMYQKGEGVTQDSFKVGVTAGKGVWRGSIEGLGGVRMGQEGSGGV